MNALSVRSLCAACLAVAFVPVACEEDDKNPPKSSGPPIETSSSTSGSASGGAGGEGGEGGGPPVDISLCACLAALDPCGDGTCFSDMGQCTECAIEQQKEVTGNEECWGPWKSCTTTALCFSSGDPQAVVTCLKGCNGDPACLYECSVPNANDDEIVAASKKPWLDYLECMCPKCASVCQPAQEPMCGEGGAGGAGGAGGSGGN